VLEKPSGNKSLDGFSFFSQSGFDETGDNQKANTLPAFGA